MFLAQGFVYLLLKFNVWFQRIRNDWTTVRLHAESISPNERPVIARA
jgi:hypothetical protein